MSEPIRVLIVDDHAIVREGLRMVLSGEPSVAVVGEATNGVEAIDRAAELTPDVILMDLVMPEMDGIAALRRLREAKIQSHVLVLTTFVDDERVRDAIRAGATGYLLKDVLQPELVQAIHLASEGKPALHPEVQHRIIRHVVTPASPSPAEDLTHREREVLGLLARGHSNKEIAAALHLSHGTVKTYVTAILGKLGVADRTQAALYAVKHGLEAAAPES
jgi:two-component system, NarL family, response regulator LiaR